MGPWCPENMRFDSDPCTPDPGFSGNRNQVLSILANKRLVSEDELFTRGAITALQQMQSVPLRLQRDALKRCKYSRLWSSEDMSSHPRHGSSA